MLESALPVEEISVIDIAKVAMLVISTLVLAGGIVGFVKGKSKASLIAGLATSLLLDVSFGLTLSNERLGLIVGDAVMFVLFMIGSIRFRKTKRYMPGGLMMTLGAIGLAVITLALVKG